jgi:hypothetical protein
MPEPLLNYRLAFAKDFSDEKTEGIILNGLRDRVDFLLH